MLHFFMFLSFQLIFSFFVQAQAQATSLVNGYDGDGTTDVAVWRPSTGGVLTSRSNFAAFFTRGWGLPGDVPVVDQLTILQQIGLVQTADLVMKAARVSGVTGQWGGVSFGQTFTDPIVVAGPLSNFDREPAGVRVRNVTATGFQVQAQEWDSQDGVHGAEQLSYVALARGRYTLGNGKVVLAESTSVTGGGFQTKTFSQPFATVPIIIATVVTQNELSAVAVQIQNVTTTGFQIRLREQEANAQAHAAETVHYLAWEPGSGTVNGLHYEVGSHGVSDIHTSQWFAAIFAGTPVFPLFLSAAQTTAGEEAYSIRLKTVTRARVEERLQEDDSFDTESQHAVETVGYLVLGTPGPPGVGKDAVFVAMGDSITFGLDDDIPSDDFQDGTLPPAGYPPILTNAFASQRGKNVLIINEGIPGDRSTDGLEDVENIVNSYSAANYVLLLYGANDVYFNVASGAGLLPGQLGYLGSFKGNMQQLIDAIRNAGKMPVLAKVLYQTNPSVDARIQEYNQVINELVTQNNLAVTPPDFYTFFKTNPSQLSDGLHPNGVGYQSMPPLWYNSFCALNCATSFAPTCSGPGWGAVGGLTPSAPHASVDAAGRVRLFARGVDNGIWQNIDAGGGFTGWTPLGGLTQSSLASVVDATNRVRLFARGVDNGIWQNIDAGGGFTGWTPLGGLTPDALSAVRDGAHCVRLFARGVDDGIWQNRDCGGGFQGWAPVGGLTPSAPAAVVDALGHVHLFVRGLDNGVWQNIDAGGGFTGWTPVGGRTESSLAAVVDDNDDLHLYARGLDQRPWENVLPSPIGGCSWTGWQPLRAGGQTPSGPAAVADVSGVVRLFVQGTDAGIYEVDSQ